MPLGLIEATYISVVENSSKNLKSGHTNCYLSDIELVLGIVGSTIGAVICILFPVSLFIQQVSSNTAEKLVAQVG